MIDDIRIKFKRRTIVAKRLIVSKSTVQCYRHDVIDIIKPPTSESHNNNNNIDIAFGRSVFGFDYNIIMPYCVFAIICSQANTISGNNNTIAFLNDFCTKCLDNVRNYFTRDNLILIELL